MDEFKYLDDDPETVSLYFHLCILPYLDMLRQQNKLKHGKKQVELFSNDADYEGEMDENGDCVGLGTATLKNGFKWYGTWLNNELHGIGRFSAQHSQNIS